MGHGKSPLLSSAAQSVCSALRGHTQEQGQPREAGGCCGGDLEWPMARGQQRERNRVRSHPDLFILSIQNNVISMWN